MGYTTYRLDRYRFWVEGIFQGFQHASLQIEVSQIIIHKTDKPDVVMNFFDADGLAGKDRTEVNFLAPQTDAAAVGDDNDLVVERVIDIGQSCIGAGGRLIDLGRALHVQGFMRTFVIEDFDEVVEPGLL